MFRPRLTGTIALLACVVVTSARAAPLIENTPAIASTRTVEPWGLDFRFSHHFQVLGPKLLNSPTFMLEAGILERLSVTLNYGSSSSVGPRVNEVEPRATYTLLRPDSAPLGLAAVAGYNTSAASVDGMVVGERTFGPLTVLATLRGFSNGYDSGGFAAAASGGVTLALNRNLRLVGDVGRIFWSHNDVHPDSPPHWAWSGGLAFLIPYSMHSMSLYATNIETLTMEGGVMGTGTLRIGFQFLVPFRNANRWGEIFAPPPAPTSEQKADVEVVIQNYRFDPRALKIRPGTTVRFVNRDSVPHTVTAVDRSWDSGVMPPGGSWVHRFDSPGDVPYTCTLHPYMRATVTVAP